MGHMPYYSDKHSSTAVVEQAGQAAEVGESHNRAGHGAAGTVLGDSPAGVDAGIAHLDTVAAGILNGISPLQFMDNITAGNQELGNRAFLHWVGQLHADGADEQKVLKVESAQPPVGPGGPPGPHRSKLLLPVPLRRCRSQGKKDKKNKDNKPEEEDDHDLPALEAASLELVNPVGNPGPSSHVDGSMEIQQAGVAMENEAAGSSAEDTDSNSDYEDDADELMASYFPAVSSIYNRLTDRG